MSGEPLYVCENLAKRRAMGSTTFELCVPHLEIHAGEVVVLRGPSGCGKSTLLDLLALALKPDTAGLFRLTPPGGPGQDLTQLWARNDQDTLGRVRAAHIGYVLQTGGLLPFLSAGENIDLPARLLGRNCDVPRRELARRLGIGTQLGKPPGKLSVGERQRVAIARALVHRPDLLLADEPTASVDPLNARVILGLLVDLARESGAVTILASHDWRSTDLPGVRVLEARIERSDGVTRTLFGDQPP